MNRFLLISIAILLTSLAFAAPQPVLQNESGVHPVSLTHGPMLGDMSDSSVNIWVRADRPCEYEVIASPENGGNVIKSETVQLKKSNNFSGSAHLTNLSPQTHYQYDIFLNREKINSPIQQKFRTFPVLGATGVIRIAFGHSLPNAKGRQITWRAIQSKNPGLVLLMGDNIYSNDTRPEVQRRMYLQHRADPHFRALGSTTPVYAVWDDHDYGKNNSDRTQKGKEHSLRTFFEIWPNPSSQSKDNSGIWTRFTVGQCEFWLLDVRYHRSPNDDPDGPAKTMLGVEQREWLLRTLDESTATFKFLVSGSSWHCGGVEAWNHQFLHEYDSILSHIRTKKITGIILLGGDQHACKVSVRPRESWGGYDLHEWMAGQLWNDESKQKPIGFPRAFGMITVDTRLNPPAAALEFFDQFGKPYEGVKIPYTAPGALRALWNSPAAEFAKPPRSSDGELRPHTSGPIWDALPKTAGYTLTLRDLSWPENE